MSDTTVSVRLPEGVHKEIERLARESGVTPAQFLAAAAVEKVGALLDPDSYFAGRAARASAADFDRIMNRDDGEPPQPGDEIV